jgi:hypothetical protein
MPVGVQCVAAVETNRARACTVRLRGVREGEGKEGEGGVARRGAALRGGGERSGGANVEEEEKRFFPQRMTKGFSASVGGDILLGRTGRLTRALHSKLPVESTTAVRWRSDGLKLFQ